MTSFQSLDLSRRKDKRVKVPHSEMSVMSLFYLQRFILLLGPFSYFEGYRQIQTPCLLTNLLVLFFFCSIEYLVSCPSNVPILHTSYRTGSDTHSGITLPAEPNGGNGEAVNGAISSESPDTAESMADNAGLSVPPVSPGGPESGTVFSQKISELFEMKMTNTMMLVESHTQNIILTHD